MIRFILIILFALSVSACGAGGGDSGTPSATDRAFDELQRRYDSLQQQFDELTGEDLEAPVDWAAEDLENIGDWEYRVVDLGRLSGAELEAALNELGNERWEVIWIDESLAGRTAILKRPSISVLSKLPLSAIGRLLLRDSGTQ